MKRMRKQSPLEGFLKNIVVSDWEPKMNTGSPSKGSSLWQPMPSPGGYIVPVIWLGGGVREAQSLQRGIVGLDDTEKLFRDVGRGGDFVRAEVCVAEVLD